MVRLNAPLLWALLSLGVSLHITEGTEPAEQIKNLSHKNLQTIPTSEVNSTVTTLLLSDNQIRLNETDRLALVSYCGLTRLNMDNNNVRNITAKYFTEVSSLKMLSLSGNKISRLDAEAFSGLDGLTQLDLSNNTLTIFPLQQLKTLPKLQLLNVKGNPWNCSCEALQSLSQAQQDTTFHFATNVTCASPPNKLQMALTEAVAKCFPSPTTTATKAPTAETSTVLKATPTGQFNDSRSKDQQGGQSNSWKFTISVAALGLTTAMLIVCAIKGPSWYRLFHNYRHRRLHNEPVGTTVFHQTHRHQQTYNFEQDGGRQTRTQEEEDEDGYFEDPYIRRDEEQD